MTRHLSPAAPDRSTQGEAYIVADNQRSSVPPVQKYGGASFETMAVAPLLGDGYSYDRATLEELAKLYESLADKYRLDRAHAEVIARTKPPGLDSASGENAAIFRDSGNFLLGSLVQCESYCREQVEKYRKALRKYTSAEEENSADLGKTGGNL
ncbi:hypothetical protein F9C11_13095 [Amycolatopsis sp. VS8301801F10]|uniref:hypothetical protein n=1 Tax=Amycolatopsis sp. VS8301801F10 TaxID=2652442 RepID=UPI0038FD0690